jgi:transcription elongation factor Elf1
MDKNFVVKCNRCSWSKVSTGTSDDLKDLFEIKTCTNCGRPRQFRCPKCGMIAKLTRIKGNNRGTRN